MSRLSLSKKLIMIVMLAFVLMLINASLDLVYEYRKNTESLKVLETSLRENYDASIKMQIETLFTTIETMRIQNETDGISEDESKEKIAEVIREIKYGENGYFWADTVDGYNIVLYGSDTEGTNRYDFQDFNGKYIVREIIQNGLRGGGFTDYVFPKAGETQPQPKRAYSNYYEPFGWVIGTGIYTNDIDQEIIQKQEEQQIELRRNMILHLLLLVSFFSVVTVFILIFSRKFVRMIIFSSTYAKSISEGEFGLVVPEHYLKRKDELGLLLRSLNEMKHSLISTFQEKEFANEQLKKEKNEIEFLSYHDLLTGIYNRRYFDLKCQELVQESAYPLTIIVADVNALKLTNDAFGHTTGDRLIRSFAHVLRSVAREQEYLFRIGGDEFVMLLPFKEKKEGLEVIESVKSILARTYVGSIPLSAAFGCYTCENSETQFEEAFRQADEAMYKNKLKENEAVKMAILDSILDNNKHMFWNQADEIGNVLFFCNVIGEKLNFTPIELNRLLKAAAIYNIGYSTLDQSVVSKEDELNSKEWDEIRKHPMAGYHMLKNLSLYADVAEIILEHHENIDGSGYPRGLTEQQLQKETLVLSVVSDYFSMCNNRPYRKALSSEMAITRIREGIGKRYRKDIADLLEKAVGEKK